MDNSNIIIVFLLIFCLLSIGRETYVFLKILRDKIIKKIEDSTKSQVDKR